MTNGKRLGLGLLLYLPLVFWFLIRYQTGLEFERGCGGHMERAAAANNIEMATAEMVLVVEYAKKHDLTSGNTSILNDVPTNDVGFWYQNMEAVLAELQKVKPGASELEKSNVLMKLKESVSHVPEGMNIFPHNKSYCWSGVLMGFIAFIGYCFIPSTRK